MPKTAPIDPDAQAFITAASITDPTQQSAINTLVTDLKGYGVWTKLRACYPMVGGSATAHSYNLCNTAQYQITWFGGATHSANGVGFNGTNSYGNTGYNQTTVGDTLNSAHLSYYSRTNSNGTEVEIGVQQPSTNYNILEIRTSGTTYFLQNQSLFTSASDSDSRGFYFGNRQSSNDIDGWRSGVKLVNGTTASNSLPNANIFIGAFNNLGTPSIYTTKQCAFASIGDGLTDTEAANFYTAVQAFQVTLGRSIGTQTVSDADAQAFVTNAGIVDQVEANAINNLVIGLKADSLWTKMKAIYPFVGGTSTTTSYNLRNTAQYQITWNGGVIHSSNGVYGNGVNGYGNTGFCFDSTTALSSHISTYIRTNSNTLACEFGSGTGGGIDECFIVRNGATYLNNQCDASTGRLNPSVADARGLILNSRTANNSWKTYKNSSLLATGTNSNSYVGGFNFNLHLFRRNNAFDLYSTKETAFASIGDGLTDTDVTNLNSRVTTFQTALNRNV